MLAHGPRGAPPSPPPHQNQNKLPSSAEWAKLSVKGTVFRVLCRRCCSSPTSKFPEKGKGRAQGAQSGRERAGRGRTTQEGLGKWGEPVTTPQMFKNNGTGSEPWKSATSSLPLQSTDEPQEAEAEFSWFSRMIRQQTGPIRRGLVETWVQNHSH